jgi:hypothetical protein
MSGTRTLPKALAALRLHALYRVSELAKAVGVSHRRFQRLLRVQGVQLLRCGRFMYVPLSELEDKIPPLWDSIKAAEMLRSAIDDA